VRKSRRKKCGRRPKGAPKPVKEPTALAQEGKKTILEIKRELNQECALGCKKNSQGNVSYKLHLDVSDIGFPISAPVTGAHVHDSQVAIRLEKMTMGKVRHFYSVMDTAYDEKEIKSFVRRRRRVPVINSNPRNNKNYIPLDPAKQERYIIRTMGERAYSH
jgi:hypothetical protein